MCSKHSPLLQVYRPNRSSLFSVSREMKISFLSAEVLISFCNFPDGIWRHRRNLLGFPGNFGGDLTGRRSCTVITEARHFDFDLVLCSAENEKEMEIASDVMREFLERFEMLLKCLLHARQNFKNCLCSDQYMTNPTSVSGCTESLQLFWRAQ